MISTIFWIFAMSACGGTVEPDTSPEGVAAVAEAIEADPGHADQALAEAGFDKESFDAVLYDIAADPALTKRYLDARE